jgi:hypothetical protein
MDARWSYSEGSGESMGMGQARARINSVSHYFRVLLVSCSNVFPGSAVSHVPSKINDFQCFQHL